MSVYMITYFISDTNGSCGCGEDHHHDSSCGCGDNHEHHHDHEEISSEVNLVAKIKSLGAWAQFMPEGFFVKTEASAEDIFDELQSVANGGDIIFVTKIDSKTSACANPTVLDWLAQ